MVVIHISIYFLLTYLVKILILINAHPDTLCKIYFIIKEERKGKDRPSVAGYNGKQHKKVESGPPHPAAAVYIVAEMCRGRYKTSPKPSMDWKNSTTW